MYLTLSILFQDNMENVEYDIINKEVINMINDEIITNPNDELYDLQKKYNVKISRSNKSNAVYIFRTRSYRVRVGHHIPKNQNHIRNFSENIIEKNVNKDVVEKVIKKFFL